ncbi:MAG: transcriptional repressor LexA [Candidatus Zixiibacteriota bacterium]|nr:MAG: transcriptional repressor LexA [candidate division Zixibacteria bacterium]
MKKALTERQQAVLDFIRRQVQQKGYPPSIREIGLEFGIRSTNGVRTILEALERKGEISRAPRLSRSIELVKQPAAPVRPTVTRIPIVGRVAAGMPLLAEHNVDGTLSMDRDLVSGESTFALRIKGDSMVGAGIFDGDLVFARPQGDYRRGDIVVAVIGDEATVKYYHPENGNIRLEPANRFFGPLVVDRATPGFYLAGKVVGVFRKV